MQSSTFRRYICTKKLSENHSENSAKIEPTALNTGISTFKTYIIRIRIQPDICTFFLRLGSGTAFAQSSDPDPCLKNKSGPKHHLIGVRKIVIEVSAFFT